MITAEEARKNVTEFQEKNSGILERVSKEIEEASKQGIPSVVLGFVRHNTPDYWVVAKFATNNGFIFSLNQSTGGMEISWK